MRKHVERLLKLLVSLGLLAWLFWKLDWSLVFEELRFIEGGYVFGFLVFQILAMLWSAKKWASIAKYRGIHFTVWDGFKSYLTGTFLNNFFPSTIGGDIYRSLWLTKRGASKKVAFSTVIFDRFTGLFVTLALALIMGFFVWQYLPQLPFFLELSYLAITLGIFGCVGVIFFLPRAWIARIPWTKLRAGFEDALEYRDLKVWGEASLWSAIFIFFGLGISNYILFLALGYTLPFLPFLGLVFLMALYVSLPISINNIGVKEWAYGVLFVLLGVSFEAAITVALLSRLLQTGISLLALPLYFQDASVTKRS